MTAVTITGTREIPLSDLKPFPGNARRGDVTKIRASVQAYGQYRSILVRETNGEYVIVAGNHTAKALSEEGHLTARCEMITCDDATAVAVNLADNKLSDDADYDTQALIDLLQSLNGEYGATGWDDDDLTELLESLADDELFDSDGLEDAPDTKTLAERFGVPPFTVLDARSGLWQDRKRAWLAMGIDSGEGRPEGLVGGLADSTARKDQLEGGDSPAIKSGTSVFDPVLTELLIRWYSAPAARVLDPFAGGSVRGIVASRLGRTYRGVDLRPEQVAANDAQAAEWLAAGMLDKATRPRWIVGDSRELPSLIPDTSFDLMLTCPPYFDLEVYGDDPADLSRCPDYQTFLTDYTACLAGATARMLPDAFAAIVTGAIRDKRGYVLDLPSDTTRIMESLGWRLYQDAVLVTMVGSAGYRAGRQFAALRKLSRTHQAVAVYHRGNINTVKSWPEVEFGGDDTTDE